MDNLKQSTIWNKCLQKWKTGSSFVSFIFGDTLTFYTIQYDKIEYENNI